MGSYTLERYRIDNKYCVEWVSNLVPGIKFYRIDFEGGEGEFEVGP